MFTQVCFIRKSTESIRTGLLALGYNIEKVKVVDDNKGYGVATSGVTSSAITIKESSFDDTNPYRTWNCSRRIDCGDNERLFFALAALQDDSDRLQFFTNGKKFILCNRNSWSDKLPVLRAGGWSEEELLKFHKATTEEILAIQDWDSLE